MQIIRSISLAALMAVPFVASAADLGAANPFNALVFGNFTTTKFVDIEGRLAVGNDLNPGNINSVPGFTINQNNVAGNYGLVVGGKTNLNGAQVHGNAFSGGDFVYKAPTMQGNVNGNGSVAFLGDGSISGNVTYGTTYSTERDYLNNGHTTTHATTPAPINFSTVQSDLLAKSAYWGGLAANGTTTFSGGLSLTGSANGLNVFSVTTTQLTASNDFNLTVTGSNVTVLINVYGTTATMPSHAYNLHGVGVTNVLYNFVDAATLSTGSIAIDGSVLAPKAAVTGNDGQMNGTLVAASFNSGMELHDHLFTGNLPNVAPVPEPGTWAALGLGAAAMLRRRKK